VDVTPHKPRMLILVVMIASWVEGVDPNDAL